MTSIDMPAPATAPPQTAGTRLPHLAGPAAAIRQVIAAHYLRDCPHVLEIGGAGLPISAFLTHNPHSVTVIDPKIEAYEAEALNGAPCHVRHLARKFQGLDLSLVPDSYGLVLLGLSLKPLGGRPAVDSFLLEAARKARVLVIDYAPALERAAEQIPAFLALADLAIQVDLDIRLNDAQFAGTDFAERRLLVMIPRQRNCSSGSR